MNELEKARGKSLAQHFTKEAAFHEKKADHHEKCMKAHEGCQEHHEGMMGKAADEMSAHHKTKAAFHKTMAGHHEKCMKLHKGHAEHYAAMAAAHGTDDGAAKAAFATLGIELEKAATSTTDPAAATATVPEVKPQENQPTGEPTVIKTETTNNPAAVPDPKAAASGTQPTPAAAAAALAAEGDPFGVQKLFKDGVVAATQNAVKELIASPEFKKTIQEEVGNTMLRLLGEQAKSTTVKTFAVPRTGTSIREQAQQIATGATPPINTEGVAAEWSDLVSMGSDD